MSTSPKITPAESERLMNLLVEEDPDYDTGDTDFTEAVDLLCAIAVQNGHDAAVHWFKERFEGFRLRRPVPGTPFSAPRVFPGR